MSFRKAFRFDHNRFEKHFDRHEGRKDFSSRWDSDRNDRKHWKNDDDRGHSRHDHDNKFWHRHDRDDRHDDSTAPSEAPEGADVVTWTLEAQKGVTVEITAHADDNGNVVFNYELTNGRSDLNGFYLDLDNDGGDINAIQRGNNMFGSDTDGDKLDGFDFAKAIGTVGGCDKDTTEGHVVMSMKDLGISDLAELASAELGMRATGMGRKGHDSAKMAATGTFVEAEDTTDPVDPVDPIDPEEPMSLVLDFPDLETPITVLTLAFVQQDGIAGGDFDQNGLRIIDISLTGDHPTDLDLFIEGLVENLVAADSYLNEDSHLKAVLLGGDGVESDYYLYGGVNGNGEEPDTLPYGASIDPVDGMVRPTSLIDDSYEVATNGDVFLFA
ncbi:hypothetical protein PAF17_14215 [Paracoccus sp. Z330]|uniref:Uncharacterized protein n=1 Tax=Paracoccus onchidii TaxID=3017813 RepID=A0ABT4ZH52_9RHOB|nr:hypothetical protein [Paracoccus onchidii]MDB6178653.1 hypothetical protein [Paracoccus onchidii]